MKNIGFIGVGYMGYGIAKNILKSKHKLFVVANKNRKPIDKIIGDGAIEVKSLNEFSNKKLDALFIIWSRKSELWREFLYSGKKFKVLCCIDNK